MVTRNQKSIILAKIVFTLMNLTCFVCHADPSYCNINEFKKNEINLDGAATVRKEKLKNIHAFRLGKVVLVGVGVGDTPTQELINFSRSYSIKAKQKKYCTWYLNHPKTETPYDESNRIMASQIFIHKDIVRSPSLLPDKDAIDEFWKTVGSIFDQDSISFLSCALEDGYIALGCNGMAHRGPTVFGMVLAFSGCSPKHSLEIVDGLWGLNGLKKDVRLGAIAKAFELGEARKESRKKLMNAFLVEQSGV